MQTYPGLLAQHPCKYSSSCPRQGQGTYSSLWAAGRCSMWPGQRGGAQWDPRPSPSVPHSRPETTPLSLWLLLSHVLMLSTPSLHSSAITKRPHHRERANGELHLWPASSCITNITYCSAVQDSSNREYCTSASGFAIVVQLFGGGNMIESVVSLVELVGSCCISILCPSQVLIATCSSFKLHALQILQRAPSSSLISEQSPLWSKLLQSCSRVPSEISSRSKFFTKHLHWKSY